MGGEISLEDKKTLEETINEIAKLPTPYLERVKWYCRGLNDSVLAGANTCHQ